MQKLCKGKFWVDTSDPWLRQDDIIKMNDDDKKIYKVVSASGYDEKTKNWDIRLIEVTLDVDIPDEKISNIPLVGEDDIMAFCIEGDDEYIYEFEPEV